MTKLANEKTTATNTGLAKVAVKCSADTFVVNQSWFSASTFVVKIATFAKPENVSITFAKTFLIAINSNQTFQSNKRVP